MTIGSNSFTVNGEVKSLDVPPQLIDSRTLVPARAVAEGFGAAVEWDDAANTVSITDDTVYNYGRLLDTVLSLTKPETVTARFDMHAAVRMNANEINTYVEADIKADTAVVEASISMIDGHNAVEADVIAKEAEGVPTLYMTPRLEHGDAVPTQKTIENINQVADFDFISGNVFFLVIQRQ